MKKTILLLWNDDLLSCTFYSLISIRKKQTFPVCFFCFVRVPCHRKHSRIGCVFGSDLFFFRTALHKLLKKQPVRKEKTMFTLTASGKKIMRTAIAVLAVLVGIGIVVTAVVSSYKVVAAEKKLPIYSVSRGDNKIALTFDCAWGNSNTDLLLQLLKDADAKATFFVTGEFCDKYPEDVKKMYDAGHEIGNHSDAHPHVEGININDLIEDTRECSRKIKMITGEEPALYRAPYGEYDDNVVNTIEGMGMKMIQWSVDSIDWQEPDADTIIKRICDGTVSGSVLLFHNDLENTAQALPEVLSALKQKGYSFARVSDMVYFDSYHIDNSGMQIFDASALLPTAAYSDDRLLNEAMETLRENMSLQELYDLTGGVTQEMADRVGALLDEEHRQAIENASFEELREAVTNLISTVEAEQGGEPAATTPSENSGEPVETGGNTSDPSETDASGTGEGTTAPSFTTIDDYVKGQGAAAQTTPAATTPAMTETTPAQTTEAPATTPAETTTAAETTSPFREGRK